MAPADAAFVMKQHEYESENSAMDTPQQTQNQGLLPVPHEQAQKRPYPPGCPVIYVDTARKNVNMSRVEAVFADTSSPDSLSFVYQVTNGFLVKESELQYSPSCPVWAFHGNIWNQSVVWNSYQEWPLSEPRYSVQRVGTGALIHGISQEYIRYREVYDQPILDNAIVPVTPKENENATPTNKRNEPVRHMATKQNAKPRSSSQVTLERKMSYKENAIVPANKQNSRSARVSLSPQAACLERKRTSDAVGMKDKDIAKRIKAADSNRPIHLDSLKQKSQDSCQGDVSPTALGHPLGETSKDPNVITTTFFIPKMGIFTESEVKTFYDQHAESIMRTTKCKIRYCSANNDQCSKFELTGTKEQISKANNQMEGRLVDSSSQHRATLALYYLGVWNQHRRNNGETCLQYCHRTSQGKAWMFAEILPKKDVSIFPRAVIGRSGERKRRMEKQTRCSIVFVNSKSDISYYYISGDTASDVKKCKRLVQRELDDAIREGKRRH